jgi:uncharacterized membrane protein
MNRTVFLLLFALSLSHASLTYTVDTGRSGFSSVILSAEAEAGAEVFLPEDASNFRIVGGSYSIVNDTAYIEAGKTGFVTFSFSSSMLTTKTSSGWKLQFFPPEGAAVHAYMPAYATMENSIPQPAKVYAENSRTLAEFSPADTVTVYYRLEEQPAPVPEDNTALYVLAAAILAAAAVIAFALRRPKAAKHEPKPTLGMSPGKKEMMETFNENDLKIVDFLLENKGRSRRNLLERKTGISKSSLATALRRLEKRRIIEMDRTSTTHSVKLSDYFLKL